MTVRVLIVDDSMFICRRVQAMLEEDAEFKVVGIAVNGEEAVKMTAELEPDVVTMDVEMPVMDGISAVKAIMRECPTPILMLSAVTHVGAKATLEALNAGAIDFLPKQLGAIDQDREMAKRLLRRRVQGVAQQASRIRRMAGVSKAVQRKRIEPQIPKKRQYGSEKPDLLVIAASTGGPVAIQQILTQIPASCPIPILLVQHMPENFTKSFAERLNALCRIKIRQAEDGDVLQPGLALLGPGGMQMEIKSRFGKQVVGLRPKAPGEIYSPCVDITFNSIVRNVSGKVLAVVLTGMGADGKQGAELLRKNGAEIWAQDEASCTIYGMPKAIIDANLAHQIYSLDQIAFEFNKLG